MHIINSEKIQSTIFQTSLNKLMPIPIENIYYSQNVFQFFGAAGNYEKTQHLLIEI